ncbi:MAG: 30S ribosomal protein S2 [Chloroflexi bacterium RBG_13_53_26]|jgi:small subunit ribosomal protein S2|nr:MAG: 30S ribosomal protein S2 [Chloroflexi bacterium RBG_13_53_26]
MTQQATANFTSVKLLLEAGAHFGHQVGRWNPKMKKYIFIERNGIHIINLEQTMALLEQACKFVTGVVADGGDIVFVGTKKQAQEAVEQESKRCGMPYVNQRWIGGMLTNFNVIQSRVDYLVHLEDQKVRGFFGRLTKKEALKMERTIQRLNQQMGSFKEMTKFPSALFIIDPSKERIAVAEARHLKVPIVAVVDTNCNPDEIDYPIPANDDAVRAVKLMCSRIADAVMEGKMIIEKAEQESAEKAGEEAIESLASLTFVPEEEVSSGDFSDLDKGVEREN